MASKSAKESPASLLRLEAKSIRRKVEQCCFPYCEERSGVGSEANLEKLNKSLTEDTEPAQKLWNRNGREGSSTAGASIQDITEHRNRSSIGFKDDINGQNEAGFEHDDESYHATLDNNE